MEITPSTRAPRRRARPLVVRVAVALLLLVAVGSAAPVVLGLQRVAMADDAMGPDLSRGSYVLVHRVPITAMAAGDVVALRSGPDGDVLVRRVVGISGDRLVVTGDAGPSQTLSVSVNDTRRVVWHVAWLGWPMLLAPGWLVPALGVALVLAFLLLLARGGWRTPTRRVVPAFLVPAPAAAPTVPVQAPVPPASAITP